MELTQENVEKLNVAKMPDALLCKGLLLDAIEAVDALEKELSNLRQDYRKNSELYISEQNKCGHLEARIKELESIPHTDNTSVIDALQRDKDDLIALNEKRIARIKQLEVVVSKMETTQKWISVKDRPPKEGEIIYGAGKFLKGLFVLQNEEWYTKEEYDDFAFEETHGYNIDAIDFWTDPPKPPTTEDSSGVEKEK